MLTLPTAWVSTTLHCGFGRIILARLIVSLHHAHALAIHLAPSKSSPGTGNTSPQSEGMAVKSATTWAAGNKRVLNRETCNVF